MTHKGLSYWLIPSLVCVGYLYTLLIVTSPGNVCHMTSTTHSHWLLPLVMLSYDVIHQLLLVNHGSLKSVLMSAFHLRHLMIISE